MSHMQPQLEHCDFWEIETERGVSIIPTDVADFDEKYYNENDDPHTTAAFVDTFSPYVKGDRWSHAERKNGYLWRLSAPGYMDCTEWTPAEWES